AGEVGGERLGRAARAPGLRAPLPALEGADEVHQLPGAQRIVHDMPARPDPVHPQPARHARRELLHRHDPAPDDDPGELRLVLTEERLADARVHAVRADQRVAFDRLTFEREPNLAPGLGKTRAPGTEMNRVGFEPPHGGGEHAEEIRPVNREIRVAVALDRDLAEVEELPGLPAIPEADFLARRFAGKRLELLADAELVEDARAVRAELHPGADLLELGRLLVDLDVEPF